jgi:hypothetical protein
MRLAMSEPTTPTTHERKIAEAVVAALKWLNSLPWDDRLQAAELVRAFVVAANEKAKLPPEQANQ